MAQNDLPRGANGRVIDWKVLVKKRWGKEWNKPETVYRFTGNREFKSTDATNHGFYSGTGS